ncbi:TonB-dependent vitamin B12 receptor [Nitrosomonas marina]|uniref:Vitamin B12 transporter n=1 Tax=Nitrosomonas marina TaxID=917 RepID=A0A1H8IQC6_9PROT|nr:TonB-dependent vitamin B12 receptor [Nitrosomonas marina]SEN70206.1 vitamin B12 transporter [Nitrosomonas marina]
MPICRYSATAVRSMGAAATIVFTTAFAETDSYTNQEKPIIVTATRTSQTADSSLASVTVVSRADIERQQARSIQDLFRGLPGVSIANKGGPGKNTSVFLRGTNADHLLVMIDNIKVGSATSGTTAFQNIPIEQIERIEIVRGPRSSLYGSEAIGGVIHIFTRKGEGRTGLTPNFSFGGGSYGSINGSAGLSGRNKQGWFNLTASGQGSNGFNACNGKPSPGGAGCFTNEPDRDGYRNIAGSARAGYRFKNGLEIDANFMHSAGRTQFDGSSFSPNRSIITQQVLGGIVRYSLTDLWRASVIAGRSKQNSDNFQGRDFFSQFNTRRDNVTLLNDLTFGKNHLTTLGFDYQNDHVESTADYAITSRNNWAVFGQHQARFAKHDMQFSLRHDENQQFGGRVTGGAGWGYPISDNTRITANFGSAYKAPTFNELYFPGFGNPNLRPEESRSYELGIKGKKDWGAWSLNVYETHIDNLIATAFDDATERFFPDNVDKARIRGLEAVVNTRIKGWWINGNLTFLDPENRSSGANRGNVLARRAEQTFRLDTNRTFFDKITIGAMFLAEGERFDNLSNTRKLDSYTRLDLRSEYRINKNWRLQGRIENLFDKHYETASFFNQPGRNFFVTLRYQPSS